MSLTLHGFRRLADRVRRRVRGMFGRHDNSPWILMPKGRRAGQTLVDFVFALDYLSPNSRLLRIMHEQMGARGLSTLLINSSNIDRAVRDIKSGRLRPHCFVDLCSHPGDPFEQLLKTAGDAGIYTVIDTSKMLWASDKVFSHGKLAEAGFRLPPTVIFRNTEPDRELTDQEKQVVGDCCVIKPSFGCAGAGAKLRINPAREVIAAAREYNRRENWLIQKMMPFARCGQRPAYFRIYNVMGHRSILWWSLERHGYEPLSWQDVRQFDLLPLLDIADRIARLTGIDYFSTEVAGIEGESGDGRFCLIDYVNDQCDMDPEGSPSGGVPEAWTRWVCGRFADFTWRRKHGLPPETESTVFLCPPQA